MNVSLIKEGYRRRFNTISKDFFCFSSLKVNRILLMIEFFFLFFVALYFQSAQNALFFINLSEMSKHLQHINNYCLVCKQYGCIAMYGHQTKEEEKTKLVWWAFLALLSALPSLIEIGFSHTRTVQVNNVKNGENRKEIAKIKK